MSNCYENLGSNKCGAAVNQYTVFSENDLTLSLRKKGITVHKIAF